MFHITREEGMFSGGRVTNVLTDYIVDRGSHSEFVRSRKTWRASKWFTTKRKIGGRGGDKVVCSLQAFPDLNNYIWSLQNSIRMISTRSPILKAFNTVCIFRPLCFQLVTSEDNEFHPNHPKCNHWHELCNQRNGLWLEFTGYCPKRNSLFV